jgi:hypothetical protein
MGELVGEVLGKSASAKLKSKPKRTLSRKAVPLPSGWRPSDTRSRPRAGIAESPGQCWRQTIPPLRLWTWLNSHESGFVWKQKKPLK